MNPDPAMASPAKPRAVKRLLPSTPQGTSDTSPRRDTGTKSVTFRSEIIETSFGGTQSVSRMPRDSTASSDTQSPLATSIQDGDSSDNSFMTPSTQTISSTISYSNIDKTDEEMNAVTDERTSTPMDDNREISISSTASFNNSLYDSPNRRSTFSSNVTIKLSPVDTPPRRHTIENNASLQQTPLSGLSPGCSPNVSMCDSPAEWNTSSSMEDNCSVTVAVRVRPFSSRELLDPHLHNVISMSGNETTVIPDNNNPHKFAYDFSFWSFDQETDNFASQKHVYNCLAQPLLSKAFDGYNTCLFAYGQTGSGKSYSMMGHTGEPGVIPRFTEELFARIDQNSRFENVKATVEISYIEIYNEKIHDLLATSTSKANKKALRVREHPILGPYVEGLPTFVVNSYKDVQGWLTLGNKNRATACTGMNDKSSRSHSVFTIAMTQTKKEYLEGTEHDHSITSKMNLVDLAGSERQSISHTTGERFREGTNINTSLLNLGKVISLLAERSASTRKRKKVFISYRDSVLTWLLKESLGGNSKTAMLANISPAHLHIEETLSTLRYAKQARTIVNVVRVNEDPKARLIRDLRSEIDKLRRQTNIASPELNHASSLAEIASLKGRLDEKEKQMADMTKSWLDKLAQSEARKVEQLSILERAGVSFKVDNKLPNLVNLNEDPQLSEMLLYVIKEGRTKVGRMRTISSHEIQLNGALIADDHCILNNNEGVVELVPLGDAPTYINGRLISDTTILHHLGPLGDAPTYINGRLISDTTILHHGDRVILGGDHYFRVNHPLEMAANKKANTQPCTEVKDFEFARQELVKAQDARMHEEREATRRQFIDQNPERMHEEREAARRQAQEEMTHELNACRHGYENKLAKLESSLKSKDSEMQNAEGQIHRLQKQKMLLEQEVLAGRQKQKTDIDASEKIAVESRAEHSKLLQLLEAEKEQMSEKLRMLREKRASVTDRGVYIDSRASDDVFCETNDRHNCDSHRLVLQLREANKICQYLNKQMVFVRSAATPGSDPVVIVSNNKVGTTTNWSLDRFLTKLERMRDIYQSEGDSKEEDFDEIFHNHTDLWKKDEYLTFSPLPSPRLSTSFRFSPLVATPPTVSHTPVDASSSVLMRLCKDLINSSLDSINQGRLEHESLSDKTLFSVNGIKNDILSIVDILPESFQSLAGQISDDCSVAQHCCVRIVSRYQLLLHTTSLWSSTYLSLDATLINELTNEMSRLVQIVGTQLTLFYQGCENEIPTMIEESAAKILDALFLICKVCGELSLATDTDVTSLQHSSLSATESQEKLSLLTKNVEVIVSTCQSMLLKCQQIQCEIAASLQEGEEPNTDEFYDTSYRNCQGVIGHVTALVDSVNMMSQLTASAISGDLEDHDQLISCADFINNSISKLVHLYQDDRGPDSDLSILSASRVDQLDIVAQEVISATSKLISSVNASLVGRVNVTRGAECDGYHTRDVSRGADSDRYEKRGVNVDRNVTNEVNVSRNISRIENRVSVGYTRKRLLPSLPS